jgi:hypothetical protein
MGCHYTGVTRIVVLRYRRLGRDCVKGAEIRYAHRYYTRTQYHSTFRWTDSLNCSAIFVRISLCEVYSGVLSWQPRRKTAVSSFFFEPAVPRSLFRRAIK